jgi:putative membrane protein
MRTTFVILASTIVSAGAPAAFAAEGNVSDPQIAAIVVTANQADIDAGNLAKTHAQSKDVQDFAKDMVRDHTAVNKSAKDLAKKLNVTPEPNATSKSMKSDADANMAKLKTLNGAAFDKAYIDHEVTMHQSVIDALDKTLVPDASNAELKALLQKSRPTFVEHLEHAKRLQAKLGAS